MCRNSPCSWSAGPSNLGGAAAEGGYAQELYHCKFPADADPDRQSGLQNHVAYAVVAPMHKTLPQVKNPRAGNLTQVLDDKIDSALGLGDNTPKQLTPRDVNTHSDCSRYEITAQSPATLLLPLHLRQEGITRYMGWLLIIGALLAPANCYRPLSYPAPRDEGVAAQAGVVAVNQARRAPPHSSSYSSSPRCTSVCVPYCALCGNWCAIIARRWNPGEQQKHITFETHLSEKLSALKVNNELISVVLMNLLSHALKYTPAGEGIVSQTPTQKCRSICGIWYWDH